MGHRKDVPGCRWRDLDQHPFLGSLPVRASLEPSLMGLGLPSLTFSSDPASSSQKQ